MKHKFPGIKIDPLPALLTRSLRVDHAGETGAVAIYAGQRAVARHDPRLRPLAPLLQHMSMQERLHLQAFERLLLQHGVRRSRLHYMWRAAGFALGAPSAALGPNTAMACTDAVESVIDVHYAQQIETLRAAGADLELLTLLETFRLEEVEHRSTAQAHGAHAVPRLFHALVAAGCRAAVFTAERL